MSETSSPHDHVVLDREHDVRIVVNASFAILGVLGAMNYIGVNADGALILAGSVGTIIAYFTRREDRKRKTRVAEALTGGRPEA